MGGPWGFGGAFGDLGAIGVTWGGQLGDRGVDVDMGGGGALGSWGPLGVTWGQWGRLGPLGLDWGGGGLWGATVGLGGVG